MCWAHLPLFCLLELLDLALVPLFSVCVPLLQSGLARGLVLLEQHLPLLQPQSLLPLVQQPGGSVVAPVITHKLKGGGGGGGGG